MKRVIAISLLVLMGWQLTVKVAIVALWKINQEYVAENLCKNRQLPASECNGKCYLKKQLKKAEVSDPKEQFPASALHKLEISFYLLPNITTPEYFNFAHSLEYPLASAPGTFPKQTFAIFHPPQYSV